MKLSRTIHGLNVLALVGLMAACGGHQADTMTGAQPAPGMGITLDVENHNWSDMAVYSVVHGTRHRLGTVSTAGHEVFRLPSTVVGTRGVQILLRPIGGGGQFLTDQIMVNPGEKIELRIENHLPLSAWRVR